MTLTLSIPSQELSQLVVHVSPHCSRLMYASSPSSLLTFYSQAVQLISDASLQQQTSTRCAASYESTAAQQYRSILDIRIIPHLSSAQRRVLERGGTAGLWACLEEERLEALPEIRRNRPKVWCGCGVWGLRCGKWIYVSGVGHGVWGVECGMRGE